MVASHASTPMSQVARSDQARRPRCVSRREPDGGALVIAVLVTLRSVERVTRERFPNGPVCVGPQYSYRVLPITGGAQPVEYRDVDDELITGLYPFENETTAKEWIAKHV